MAVITNTINDTGLIERTWGIPNDPVLVDSFIPRGEMVFKGTKAIALKTAGNETRIVMTLTFNTSYCYLLKYVSVSILSDDQLQQWQDIGSYQINGQGVDMIVPVVSGGILNKGATLPARKIYTIPNDIGVRGNLIQGDETVDISFADIHADESAAGDVNWNISYFVYDKEQCNRYAINTPQPTMSF